MTKKGKICLLEQDRMTSTLLTFRFRSAGLTATSCTQLSDLYRYLSVESPELIILDLDLLDPMNLQKLLDLRVQHLSSARFFIAYRSVTANKAQRFARVIGADLIEKPLQPEKVLSLIFSGSEY